VASLIELHHLERRLLLALKDGKEADMETIKRRTGLPEASISRASLWLSHKNYLEVREIEEVFLQLDLEGRRFLEEGLPERRLIKRLVDAGGSAPIEEVKQLSRLSSEDFNIAIGWARKKGWLHIEKDENTTLFIVRRKPEKGVDERLIASLGEQTRSLRELNPSLVEGLTELSTRPNVVLQSREVERGYFLSEKGIKVVEEVKDTPLELSQLTSELIKSGRWRELKLRKYDIQAPVGNVWPGKKQAYKRFLDDLKWKLVALGFQEMEGPLVEFAFFNCDALFMPQDHPAREIHDIYYVKQPSSGDLSAHPTLVRNVKATHERGWKTGSVGWGYKFSLEETRRLILRSQGTALSVRMLVDKGLEIPGKYYSLSRCYRPDVVDRTHLTEFNQVEGIVVGVGLTFRDLLGVLEMFAMEIAGAEKVKFRPDYFPFTEPSVELSAYKEGAGWLEFGGAGMFRQEVTLPLGIEVPVIAWGLGVERLFMMKTGINDIRELFTQDLEWLRRQRLT
jgi:phenylalanyl-tRNA synthetase alpha chain